MAHEETTSGPAGGHRGQGTGETRNRRRPGSGDARHDIRVLRDLARRLADIAAQECMEERRVLWEQHNAFHRVGVPVYMRDGILEAQQQAEDAGDWRLADHENQSMPYAAGLPRRRANSEPVTRSQLWVFTAAQEFTLISPRMHDEFMLQYQLPIISKFALVSYGCCEDLTNKIEMVRQIPNLRRIAIAPAAEVARCAEQIGTDYICSYRPNPAETVCVGWDPERVRTLIRRDLAIFKANGCYVDVCLKDVQTVQHDPRRLREFVRIVREEAEAY